MMHYLFKYLLPGLGLILLAFFAGSVSQPFLGLLGFLCFFTVGVTLIIEGRKRSDMKKKDE